MSKNANEQEINQKRLIQNLDKFKKIFDEWRIWERFKKTIFEYKIVHIFLVDKEINKYMIEKNNCPNREINLISWHICRIN